MLLLVDNSMDGRGVNAREIHEALGRIRPSLEIWHERYSVISPEIVTAGAPSHIILSGQSHPWGTYSVESMAGIYQVIRETELPVLGICGGHQQIALAYGSTVSVMKRIAPGEGYSGCIKKRGFDTITNTGAGIFTGLPESFTVWNSHYEEVKELPEGFEATASSTWCKIQGMKHKSRRVESVQFHPELFDEENPMGRRVLENFLNGTK